MQTYYNIALWILQVMSPLAHFVQQKPVWACVTSKKYLLWSVTKATQEIRLNPYAEWRLNNKCHPLHSIQFSIKMFQYIGPAIWGLMLSYKTSDTLWESYHLSNSMVYHATYISLKSRKIEMWRQSDWPYHQDFKLSPSCM